jgi:hypothetical protein
MTTPPQPVVWQLHSVALILSNTSIILHFLQKGKSEFLFFVRKFWQA